MHFGASADRLFPHNKQSASPSPANYYEISHNEVSSMAFVRAARATCSLSIVLARSIGSTMAAKGHGWLTQ